MAVEQFGAAGDAPPISLSFMATPPLPRLWFLNDDESQLVQVQSDWFARNWRKTASTSGYPRYPTLRSTFESQLRRFVDHARAADLGEFAPTQCEITYVNHIPAEDGAANPPTDILSFLSMPASGRFPQGPEAITVAAQYLIETTDGPVGRLHVSAQPAARRLDGRPITVLSMTARGRPLGDDVQGVLAFLDLGHEWVVRGFDAVTSEKMHEAWGKVP
jgi:uncharacterized protein (TIGR04255 family)